jgi:hypothetical protein
VTQNFLFSKTLTFFILDYSFAGFIESLQELREEIIIFLVEIGSIESIEERYFRLK